MSNKASKVKSVLSVLCASAFLSFTLGAGAVPLKWPGDGGFIPCGWNNNGEPTSESCTVDDSGHVSCIDPEDCFDDDEPEPVNM